MEPALKNGKIKDIKSKIAAEDFWHSISSIIQTFELGSYLQLH